MRENKTYTYCDRCKKEIEYDNQIEKIAQRKIYFDVARNVDWCANYKEYDLCKHCQKQLDRFLRYEI